MLDPRGITEFIGSSVQRQPSESIISRKWNLQETADVFRKHYYQYDPSFIQNLYKHVNMIYNKNCSSWQFFIFVCFILLSLLPPESSKPRNFPPQKERRTSLVQWIKSYPVTWVWQAMRRIPSLTNQDFIECRLSIFVLI